MCNNIFKNENIPAEKNKTLLNDMGEVKSHQTKMTKNMV